MERLVEAPLNIDQWGVFYVGRHDRHVPPGHPLCCRIARRDRPFQPGASLPLRPADLIKQLGWFGWFLALFFGFWIMYSTAISNVDLVVRQSTDMLWFASDRVRKLSNNDIRKIYYVLLLCLSSGASAT